MGAPDAAAENTGFTHAAHGSARQTFLNNPIEKIPDSYREVSRAGPRGQASKLWNDLVVPNERTGDELRKERHKKAVVENTEAGDPTHIRVDEKRNLLKREERDAERQRERLDLPVQAEDRAHILREKARIFEITEEEEIESQPGDKKPEALSAMSPDQCDGEDRVASDRQEQDPHIAPIPPAIKKQRCAHEDDHAGRRTSQASRQKIQRANDGKKSEDELI